MDRNAFDRLTTLLASSPNRRAALSALLGGGLAGTAGIAAVAKKPREKRRTGKQGKTQVTAQAADCLSPGPSANISGCNYQDDDFSGDDLSGSKMVATNFRGAELAGTNLSSSNAKNAIFREADLTCANLRSAMLGGADFRAANLTGANLKSSGGCNSAVFNAATTFCATTMCDGSVRNDDCPGGFDPDAFCCADADCGPGEACVDSACVAVCAEPPTASSCDCLTTLVGGDPACVATVGLCGNPTCTSDDGCAGDAICVRTPCCGSETEGRCTTSCAAACACATAPTSCGGIVRCTEISGLARHTAANSREKQSAG